jgi:hypothetical protein
MMQFFRSRRWVVTRRLVLVFIVLVVGYRSWGSYIGSLFQSPNAERDIFIASAEFRPGLQDVRPGWIIIFHNRSSRFTYDKIRVEATYMDDSGKVLETDSLVISQKLAPGNDQTVASLDAKERAGATRGTLRVVGAEAVD